MRNYVKRLSLLSKALMLLIFTIIFTASVAFGLMYSEVRSVVTSEIRQGANDTLRIANIQAQERMVGGISLLIDLRTDRALQRALSDALESPAQRAEVSQQIYTIIRNAYYAIETPFKIAIVSAYQDVYANWEMVDSNAVIALAQNYYQSAGPLTQQSGLYTQVVPAVELSIGSGTGSNYYAQFMPLLSADGSILGVAMVLLSESELYNTIRFSQEDVHTTFLVNAQGIILSAADKSLLGTPFSEYAALAAVQDKQPIFSYEAPRTQMKIIDIMSNSYIEAQVWQIMQRMLLFTLLTISAIIVAAYFLMQSITNPLRTLTKRLVSIDYSSFVKENAPDVGRNEIALLTRGFSVMEQDIHTLLALNEKESEEKRAIEIASLQSQIQPHFLFNTLNTVRCSILNNRNEKAADLIRDLTALLQMTLVNGDELISMEKEVAAVEYYLDIIRMRYTTNFTFSANISEDTAQLLVPKLLLQPLAENCVLHGFEQIKQDGIVRIDSFCKDDIWQIEIRNNGKPLIKEIDFEKNAPSSVEETVVRRDSFSGIGAKNVHRRLKLYFGEGAQLRIYTDADGFTVSALRIPYPLAQQMADGKALPKLGGVL